MDKVEQLKELLKELSPEELEQFKTFLNSETDDAPTDEKSATDEVAEETPEDSVDKSEEVKDVPPEVEEKGEETPVEEVKETPVENTQAEDLSQDAPSTDESAETPKEQPTENQDTPSVAENEEIPKMQRGVEYSDDDVVETQTPVSDDGQNIPVDYEQIIEAQNAKIAALEAENNSLKNKVNGAFGYSAKPSMPVKTNRLYDDCSDVHFHK